MPRWTKEEYERWKASKIAHSGETHCSQPQYTLREFALETLEGKEGHPVRTAVSIVCRRQKLLDPDNPCVKYFVDGLRYAGLIPDDRPEDITLEVRQEKVKLKSDEATIIEIS